MVVMILQKLGVDARATGRNDVLIGDRKVSGNAFYHVPGRSIVHGTMLYDTDMQNMVGAITPSSVKLTSKGIQSVRQRIALLKDYLDITLEQFKQFVRENLCNEEIMLTQDDVEKIREIEAEYLKPEFIYGNNPRYSMVKKGHIANVGDLEVRLEMKNNVIKDLTILGDFFIVGEVDEGIVRPLHNVELSEEALRRALPDDMSDIVMNLRREDFMKILLG